MNNCSHRVSTVTSTGTNLVLTVSDSTNIGNGQRFDFYFPRFREIGNVITAAPLPTLINVNGANVQLINRFDESVLSNMIPRRSSGVYIVPAIGAPYVKLFNTPFCVNPLCGN